LILDGHIHIDSEEVKREELSERMNRANVDGGLVISLPPESFADTRTGGAPDWPTGYKRRLDNLLSWTEESPLLYPFFWIDPLEEDVCQQVQYASEREVSGFKVICNRFYPDEERPLEVFKAVAEEGKPLLFHSGISYGGANSSKYHRPARFEALLEIEGLRFSLAHISWPWCDELIAVYGKYQNVYKGRLNSSVEMYIDITPGTPPIYREEALRKLFRVGYEVEDNVIFGTDNRTTNYDYSKTERYLGRDDEIYDQLDLAEETRAKIYHANLETFLRA